MKNSIIALFVVLSVGLLISVAYAETGAGTISVSGNLTVQSGTLGKVFVLDGTKSQDDGDVARYHKWRQTSGPMVSLSDASAVSPSFTPQVAGTYVFELVVTDATGLSSVAQRAEFTVGNDAPEVAATLPPGDPDFDLKTVSPSTGFFGSDGGVGDTTEGLGSGSAEATSPTVTNEGRDRIRDTDQQPDDGKMTGDPDFDLLRMGTSSPSGDPDFDLLNIDLGGDDLEDFRAEVSSGDQAAKVTVRGWDPEKKEEIVARPEEVRTADDLKVYTEAVALRDIAIKGIKIKENAVEVESREAGKLLWLIPVEMTARVTVNFTLQDSSADLASVKVKFPWWHVFVKKSVRAAEIEQKIEAELSSTKPDIGGGDPLRVTAGDKLKMLELQNAMSRYSQTLQTISNVLKTRHDTAKNSIRNMK